MELSLADIQSTRVPPSAHNLMELERRILEGYDLNKENRLAVFDAVNMLRQMLDSDELLTPVSLLEWCQGELTDVEARRPATNEYKQGILDGVQAVLTSLILHFDLEGK